MLLLLILPVIGIILFAILRNPRVAGGLNILLAFLGLIQIAKLALKTVNLGSLFFYGDLIYLDSLSVFELLIIGTISLIVAIYSYSYVAEGKEAGAFTGFQVKLYYVLFNCFLLSMLMVVVFNNLGLMWIALEGTTLSTAFFIGFNRTKSSLEAAWKYIIICTLGIGLGLLGISLFMYGAISQNAVMQLDLANWTVLMDYSGLLDPRIAAIAFGIILIGFGTKAGLAPMHTWLPDAYSESPSPITSMMSGIVVNLALYGVVRLYILAAQVVNLVLLQQLLLGFGVISLVVAAASILRQKNYKRLLAFSSVEQMGMITLGLGFGGTGIFFALFHSIIHALSKSLLFLVSGNIFKIYQTKEIAGVRGMFKKMPVNTFYLLVGILAITGMPPFASFVSEFGIIKAGVQGGYWFPVAVLAFVLLLVFAGFIVHFSKMLFYNVDDSEYVAGVEKVVLAEVAASKEAQLDRKNILAPGLLAVLIIGFSIYIPDFLQKLLEQAAAIIG